MDHSSKQDVTDTWKLVDKVLSLVRPFGAITVLFGIISLAGYFGSIEGLYRPIDNGPATHPLTALIIVLLGFSLYKNVQDPLEIKQRHLFAFLAFIFTVIRLTDVVYQSDFSQYITPFLSDVLRELQTGKSNYMGVNTALMLLFISSSIVAYNFKKYVFSQMIATVAIAMPLITILGYTYGLTKFYGQMSLFTATAGFALSVATVALTADKGLVHALLSPHIGGKVARFQFVTGYIFPVVIGYFIVKLTVAPQGSLFGVFVVGVCWFIMIMVGISALVVEKVDHKRRLDEEKLHQAATTDSLTGLFNRRVFFDAANHEMARLKRSGTSLSVLMLDVDFFKKINDKAGHAIGDQVLIQLSQMLKSSLREVDIIARVGGEEFAIILPDTSQEGAQRVAENLRRNVEKIVVANWTPIYGPVTISIGVAKVETNTQQAFDDILANADKALYQSKANGRNQVSLYQIDGC